MPGYGANFAKRVLGNRWKVTHEGGDELEGCDLIEKDADDNNGKGHTNFCVLKGDGLCIMGKN